MPFFDPGSNMTTNLTVQMGSDVFLSCPVQQLGPFKVSFISTRLRIMYYYFVLHSYHYGKEVHDCANHPRISSTHTVNCLSSSHRPRPRDKVRPPYKMPVNEINSLFYHVLNFLVA